MIAASNALCQQTPNSTPTDDLDRRAQLLAALERAQDEVRAGRKYVDALKEQISSKEKLIDALNERDAKRIEVQTRLITEINSLQQAIITQKKTIEVREQEVSYLKAELDKSQKKLRSAKKWTRALMVVAGVLAAIVIAK